MVNTIGFTTLVRREIKRTIRIINQAVWPPAISTLLYFFIFGVGLGSRIQTVDGVPYLSFLVPGLIALNVIESSYSESSASLFQGRFMNSIQELLVAPLSYLEMVTGFLAGSVLRALIIGTLIMAIGWGFTGTHPQHWILFYLTMAGISVVFSAIGLILALFADSWDQLAFPTTFLITPLVYFGGVFTSVHMLPARFQVVAKANPLFYLIDAFRSTVTGRVEGSLAIDLGVLVALIAVTVSIALYLFRRGHNLRT